MLNQTIISGLLHIGTHLDKIGKFQEAIECFDRALAAKPNFLNAIFNKGACLQQLKKYQEAIECYDKVLSFDPNYIGALNNKGLALVNLGKSQEAIEYFDKSLAIDPTFTHALFNRGKYLYSLGKRHEAIECYDKVLSFDPNYIDALQNKGLALMNLGKSQEAMDCLDKSFALDPSIGHVLYRGNLEYFFGNIPHTTPTDVERLDPKINIDVQSVKNENINEVDEKELQIYRRIVKDFLTAAGIESRKKVLINCMLNYGLKFLDTLILYNRRLLPDDSQYSRFESIVDYEYIPLFYSWIAGKNVTNRLDEGERRLIVAREIISGNELTESLGLRIPALVKFLLVNGTPRESE